MFSSADPIPDIVRSMLFDVRINQIGSHAHKQFGHLIS